MKKLKDLKLGTALSREQMKNTKGGSCHTGSICGYYHNGHTTYGECGIYGIAYPLDLYKCMCSATPYDQEVNYNGESHCQY